MIGAIIGDVIGSAYEFHNVKRTDISLFSEKSVFTDDSILTVALMDSLMTGMDYALNFRIFARRYGHLSVWGPIFSKWVLRNDNLAPDSFGNGASMRISPIAWWYNDLDKLLLETKKATVVSHNHIEAIKGATAISVGIWGARNGYSKVEIKNVIEKHTGYKLDFNLDDIRETNKFDSTCQVSVPLAVKCFLESDGFEDSIRLAVSIGGDSDTMGAMAGSIAEAYYGVPLELWEQTCERLDGFLSSVVKKFLIEMKQRGVVGLEGKIECIKVENDLDFIDWDAK